MSESKEIEDTQSQQPGELQNIQPLEKITLNGVNWFARYSKEKGR